MRYFVVVLLSLLLATHVFAVNPVARWPLDDQAGTTTIREVIAGKNDIWIGTELVTDGAMTNSANWTDPGTWTVAGNIATRTANATNPTLTPAVALTLTVGKRYTISFALASTAGTLTVTSLDGTQTLNTYVNGVDSDGTKTITAKLTGDDLINFTANASFAGTVDDVSIREIAFSTGTGITFDGVGDYVDIGSGPFVKTISLWINQDDVAGNEYPIDLNGTDYLSVESGVVTVNGLAGHTLYVDGVAGTSGVTTIDATWHHIVITDSTSNNASDLDIGRADIGPAVYFAGRISDVRLYGVVLTADQVKGLFRGEGRKLRARYNNKEYEPSLRSRYN